MAERPATTHVRCPKCRSRDLVLVETGEWASTWTVRGGRLDRAAGFHEPACILRIDAQCTRCQHFWKLRGGIQITDFCKEPSDA
jgi:DNA-directed RNA polymerase subunit RPC12/RpoP